MTLDLRTRAVMMLAAFAIFFALVCPVAVTPIAVQKTYSPYVSILAIIVQIIAILVMASHAPLEAIEMVACPAAVSRNELNCVRLC